MPRLILNQSQARAVYDAMCALNNVGARINVLLPAGGGLAHRVYESLRKSIVVRTEVCGGSHELHETQDAFRTAYGIE